MKTGIALATLREEGNSPVLKEKLIQCSTVTVKSLYVITYICQNLGVCDVLDKYQN